MHEVIHPFVDVRNKIFALGFDLFNKSFVLFLGVVNHAFVMTKEYLFEGVKIFCDWVLWLCDMGLNLFEDLFAELFAFYFFDLLFIHDYFAALL